MSSIFLRVPAQRAVFPALQAIWAGINRYRPFSDTRQRRGPGIGPMPVYRLRRPKIIVKKNVDFPLVHTIIRSLLGRPDGFFRRLDASINVFARFFAPADYLRFSIKHPRRKNVPNFIVTISGITCIARSTIRKKTYISGHHLLASLLLRIRNRAHPILHRLYGQRVKQKGKTDITGKRHTIHR
jgi:hypothetical protein